LTDFQAYSTHCKQWVEDGIKSYLASRLTTQSTLIEAMRYSVLNGGKRIRAMLVHGACMLASGEIDFSLPAACAVEFIHSYSLIHDDLPVMDDDDIRRGKPSCHKVFGEAVAILAGDAMQSLAFEILATSTKLEPELKLQQIASLAKAAGAQGMAGGQAIDIAMTGFSTSTSINDLEAMHLGKTGALISASLSLGAYAASADNGLHAALATYGRAIGLAFQVQDDILDIISDSETLGKPQGSDKSQQKTTYVSLMGLEKAGIYLGTLLEEANDTLANFKSEANPLRWVANYITSRTY